jgi:hypothetical protein
MLLEPSPDVYQISERAQRYVAICFLGLFLTADRCLPLLRGHDKRGELVSLLIDAGDSAWARGAHEVRCLLIRDFFWRNAQASLDGISIFGQRPLSSRSRCVDYQSRSNVLSLHEVGRVSTLPSAPSRPSLIP